MTKPLAVAPLFPTLNWDQVKIHVAQFNGLRQPLDVFASSFEAWRDEWNGGNQRKHYWNRPFVFSMIELPKQPEQWLFGGIFRVDHHSAVEREGRPYCFYELSDTSHGSALIGRLVIHWKKDGRPMARKPESILAHMTVAEIRALPYVGEDFPGHGNIHHRYAVLEGVWRESKQDWRGALENCSGVYLITDTKAGLRYVGSAYGEEGIYARWSHYFKTGGHGGNARLKKHLAKKGVEYAREHFEFALLEQLPQRYEPAQVIARENYWKQLLLTRGAFGLNDN